MKFEYVEKFSDFLVRLTTLYTVKNDYVVTKEGTKVTVTDNKKKRPLKVIRAANEDVDAVILNPLNEGLGDRSDTRWFYAAMAGGMYRRFITFISYLGAIKKMSEDDEDISADVLKLVSNLCKNVDDSLIDDIKQFDSLEFINIFYNKKMKKAMLRCAIYEDNHKKKFKAKNLKELKRIFSILLGTEDISEFTYKSDLMTCPKLHSILMVYYRVLDKINEYMDMIVDIDEDFVVDMTEFSAHLENIKEYYDKVKWIAQTTTTEDTEKPSPLSSNIPVQNERIPTTIATSVPYVDNTVSRSSMPIATTPMNQFGTAMTHSNIVPQQQMIHQQQTMPQQIIQQPPAMQIFNDQYVQPAVPQPLSFAGFSQPHATTIF